MMDRGCAHGPTIVFSGLFDHKFITNMMFKKFMFHVDPTVPSHTPNSPRLESNCSYDV